MQDYVAHKPNFDRIDLIGVSFNATNLTWDFVKRLRDTVRTKIVRCWPLTSALTASLSRTTAAASTTVASATIETLPEIVEVVGARMPELVDRGFRRGTDIVKALAMGAQAVCIGRPYLWGLGAFGPRAAIRTRRCRARRLSSGRLQQRGRLQ
jgi:4-hydroxymandelate oxidase